MATSLPPADTSGSDALNSVIGLADGVFDIWSRWSQQKVENQAARAAIPSAVIPAATSGGFTLDSKTLLIAGAGVVALVLVLTLTRRK
jgi:hypothetical protein